MLATAARVTAMGTLRAPGGFHGGGFRRQLLAQHSTGHASYNCGACDLCRWYASHEMVTSVRNSRISLVTATLALVAFVLVAGVPRLPRDRSCGAIISQTTTVDHSSYGLYDTHDSVLSTHWEPTALAIAICGFVCCLELKQHSSLRTLPWFIRPPPTV